jgi:hypothetical protein
MLGDGWNVRGDGDSKGLDFFSERRGQNKEDFGAEGVSVKKKEGMDTSSESEKERHGKSS